MRAPDGTLATVLSLFPTAAPFLMLLRISLQPGPPMWQIVLSVLADGRHRRPRGGLGRAARSSARAC